MFDAIKNFFKTEVDEKYIIKDVYGFFLPASVADDEKYAELLVLLENVFTNGCFTTFSADCEYLDETAVAIGVVISSIDSRFGNFDLSDCHSTLTNFQIEHFNENWTKIPVHFQEMIKNVSLNGSNASRALISV